MKQSINWRKVILFILLIVLASLAALYGQPLLHNVEMQDGKEKVINNELAINVIVTVFSILAGFLVAIIAIIGDPALLPQGTWRIAELEQKKIHRRLIRHQWLFMAYLITLASIFLSLIFQKICPALSLWLERLFLFLGFIAFTYSLFLPNALMKVQKEKIDAVIEDRRRGAGIDKAEE